jgi:predicted AAA+ superfamily ATPase
MYILNMKYIKRPYYTDKIIPYIDKQLIKVLTGQRRVGKSYVLFQLIDVIKVQNPEANIIYINRELEEYMHLQTHTDLLTYLNKNLLPDKKNYLFIDEIQEIQSFEIAIRSLFAANKCDIYITGSNAKMLSGELATHLSGRYISITIHSLSYQEFLIFNRLENHYDNLLKYLRYGGMPYLHNIELNNNLPFEYLKNVYSTILLKDVVARENIRNVSFLENLVSYLADNTGSLFSASNISKYLKSQKITISTQLTINYLKALTNSYIIHKVSRSEIGGLKIFEIGEKYFFEDLGLRNCIITSNQLADLHKILENAVFLHLIQQGYLVHVGKSGTSEIDFVASKNGLKIYIQACLTISSKKTEEREFNNLLLIEDNYPKYVITLNDTIIGNDFKGVKQLNLIDFLSMEI